MGEKNKHSRNKLLKSVNQHTTHHSSSNGDFDFSPPHPRMKFNSCSPPINTTNGKLVKRCNQNDCCYVYDCDIIVEFLEKYLPIPIPPFPISATREDDSNATLPIKPNKQVNSCEENTPSFCNKHMPWFGVDIGGSLVKIAFFDPSDATEIEIGTLNRIRRYLNSSKAYGTTGKRDAHLEMNNCVINNRKGSLHFIRFATSHMPQFLAMAKNKCLVETIDTVCATGGGSYKFEEDIKSKLGIDLHKIDEMDSIIYGIHYIDKYNPQKECYYLDEPLDDSRCVKVPYDFSRPYPYLVVNIGSGVSILAVKSLTDYDRIGGSSIGGGTFLGLCCELTNCKTFDEAIRLAEAGSSPKVDKLVRDIYGGDYSKFNLSGDTVASSFGHMNLLEKHKKAKREDKARALLEMVTNNIGLIARMCAVIEGIDRVVFIGNFLRVNKLSMKLLSYALHYWSKGALKALFLEHEGYFGAVGCFVKSGIRSLEEYQLSTSPGKDDELEAISSRVQIPIQPLEQVANCESFCHKHIPWLREDIDCSLIKIAFFAPSDPSEVEINILNRIKRYVKSSNGYTTTTGKCDAKVENVNCVVKNRKGFLHFIQFPKSLMPHLLAMVKSKTSPAIVDTMRQSVGNSNKL